MSCYKAMQFPRIINRFTLQDPKELSDPISFRFAFLSGGLYREYLYTASNELSDDVEVKLDCGYSTNIKGFAAIGPNEFSV